MSGFHFSSVNQAMTSENPSDSINLFWNQQMEKNKANASLFLTPNFDPCLIISGSSKIKSSTVGLTIPYPFSLTSCNAYSSLSYSFLILENSVIFANNFPSSAISSQ